jgi:hypothetical protein
MLVQVLDPLMYNLIILGLRVVKRVVNRVVIMIVMIVKMMGTTLKLAK